MPLPPSRHLAKFGCRAAVQGVDSVALLRSLTGMLNFRQIPAITLLVLWGPVTLHCGMEVDGMFGSAPIHAAKAASPHAPVAPDTDPDGCGAIETVRFESLLTWFTVPAPEESVSIQEAAAAPLACPAVFLTRLSPST